MTDSLPKNSGKANSELEENDDEDVEHLYPIQDMAVLYEDDSADDDSVQNPGALVETEMYSEGQGSEEAMDDNGEEIDESYLLDQELEKKTYVEDFIYSNVEDGSSNHEKEEGKGSHLSRFQTIVKAVEAAEYETLQVLYQLLYQRSAWDTKEILSHRILEFSGFSFSQSSEEYFNREMMLQTQPSDVLIKLAVILGLDQIKNSGIDVDKARPGLIRCIMSFLFMPNKKTRKKGIIFKDDCWKSNDGEIYDGLSKCGCRNLCFSLIPKAHRERIRDYVKSLMVDRLLDSYLVNMIKLKKINRRPGDHAERKKLKEVTYSYFVKYDAKLINVCKGAFISIYNLTSSKMNQLQNRIKTGRNLPKKMELKDFPPMPVPSKSLENQSEDASEVVSTVSPRKRARKQKKYVPSEDENQSEEDSEIEVTNQVIKTEKQLHSSKDNQSTSSSRSSRGTDGSPEQVQLKDFALVTIGINNASKELLVDIHFLLYLNSADEGKAKERILEFSGFPFDSDTEEYDERKEFLQRMSFKMVIDVAKSFSLAIMNNKESTINNILSFLLKPDESFLRISARLPVSLSDVELDDFEDMSDDSDVSIINEVSEKKVECIDILSSDESDGESEKSEPEHNSVTTSKQEILPSAIVAQPPISTDVPQNINLGSNIALKDFDAIKVYIESYPQDYLRDIYNLLFMKPLQKSTARKQILEFKGFPFERSSNLFLKRKELLDRMLYHSVRRIYNTLCKPKEGKLLPKPMMISELLEFLLELPNPGKMAVRNTTSSPKSISASQSSLSTETEKPNPASSAPNLPPDIPSTEGLGIKSGKLSDLKRVFQRVACFPCEYLTDVHKLLFMTNCDQGVIRQNIFAFRGFPFSPDSDDFRKRKNYLEYLTFHSLRKISSVLTTKSVDLRNSTKHELVTHLAEVLTEYCGISNSKVKASVMVIDTPTPPPVVENTVTTPIIMSLTEVPASLKKDVKGTPNEVTKLENPPKIIEAHSVTLENSSKRKSTSPYPSSKKTSQPEKEDSVAHKLVQCQQVYGTTVSLVPANDPAITSIVTPQVPQGVQLTALPAVSSTVSPQITTSQANNNMTVENSMLAKILLNESENVVVKQNASVINLSDDEDCDKPLASLVGHPIDSVLEKHVDDIVKNSDLQNITINGVIKKMKLLIQDLKHSKIREIESLEALHNAVELVFQLPPMSYIIQKYDKDFDEYVDVEEFDSIDQKEDKIRILRKTQPVMQHLAVTNVILPLQTEQWPQDIKIPVENFSAPLKDCLDNEKKLSWDLSRELVSHLANYTYNFKAYPSKVECFEVCSALIQKYPYLENGGWVVKLLNKIKTIRQKDNSVEVTLTREKCKVAESKVPKKISCNPKRGELNWAPEHVPGESADLIRIQDLKHSKIRKIESLEALHNAVELVFQLPPMSYIIQKYDKDFDAYVDVEEFDSIDQKDMIRILRKTQPVMQDLAVTNVILPLRTEQWPQDIKIPVENFSAPLKDCLDNEKRLSWDLSRELVGHLANYTYNFKAYPSKIERLEVCTALIQKYPYLKNGGWEVKLLNKLKKIRQEDNSVEVALTREKCKVAGSKVPKKISFTPKRGELNWAPEHVPGESAETEKHHKDVMKLEASKLYPDNSKLSTLMALTYSFRRRAIIEKILIKDLMTEYPAFFLKNHQFEEFERLMGILIKEVFFPEAEKQGLALLRFFQKKKSPEETVLLSEFESKCKDFNPGRRKEAEINYGLFLLPHLLNDQKDRLIVSISNDGMTPNLPSHPIIVTYGDIFNGPFSIFIEGINVCLAESFVEALCLMTSYYYTLNICYPDSVLNSLKYFQHIFLKVKGGTVPTRVRTLSNRLEYTILSINYSC